uniref:Bulb-type lectin domain-containing protein n=1 Tax=Mola mola TaxID=94237 RepID=A0A3Q3WKG1_MOLML
MSKNFLSKNDELHRGDYLLSNNGEWKAVFQNDSNFVIYGWKPVWASDTYGTDAYRLCMQGDCNLVMYNKNNEPKWNTNTCKRGSNTYLLTLTDDGKLVLDMEGEEIWNSSNSKGTE